MTQQHLSTASIAGAKARPAQVPIPKIAADVAGPVPGNVMTGAYVQLVGRMAYLREAGLQNRALEYAARLEALDPEAP